CSSRRRHTRFSRDWSSDVCSSDLALANEAAVYASVAGAASARFLTWFSCVRAIGRFPRRAFASAILSTTSAYLRIGVASVRFVISLYLFENFTPDAAVLTIVPSSRRLSVAVQRGFLQIMGLIQTSERLLYIEANAAFTPGFVTAEFSMEKIDSV